jgi:hypothetical protein
VVASALTAAAYHLVAKAAILATCAFTGRTISALATFALFRHAITSFKASSE